MKKTAILVLFFLILIGILISTTIHGDEIIFQHSFRADWAHIDRNEVYDYAPSAMDDNQWKVWMCGETSIGGGQDAIFYTSFTSEGTYDETTTKVISPSSLEASEEGLHVCAPSVIKHKTYLIENRREYYKMYYECARKFYNKCDINEQSCDSSIQGGVFTQICHAVSEDGIIWGKFNKKLWDTEFRYGAADTEPTPVIRVNQKLLDNCQYEFSDGRHKAKFDSSCINPKNYGVGHPSALIFDVNGEEPDGERIWLYYYDSRGDWSERGVYLAKSWDGFNFETPIKTNLKNPIDVKYFDIPFNGQQGVFIGTMGMESDNYFAYSLDGIEWVWPNFADYPGENFDELKIDTAMETHCAAPAQAAIIGNKQGISETEFVSILSAEGYLGASDGKQPGDNCYSSQEDNSRGSTWGIYLIQGEFIKKTLDYLKGDINQDGNIDIQDIMLLIQDFGKTGTFASDINQDEKVDLFDVVLLAKKMI